MDKERQERGRLPWDEDKGEGRNEKWWSVVTSAIPEYNVRRTPAHFNFLGFYLWHVQSTLNCESISAVPFDAGLSMKQKYCPSREQYLCYICWCLSLCCLVFLMLSSSRNREASAAIFVKHTNFTAPSRRLLLFLFFHRHFYCGFEQWLERAGNGTIASASIFTGDTHML